MAVQGLILAAGRGSRMGKTTDDQPKGLIKLAGRSLIERQMEALEAAGADKIALCTGYKADMLDGFGVQRFYNARWAETNMVATLLAADDWLSSGTTIVSYSDIFYDPLTVIRLARCTDDIAISYDPHWAALWKDRFEDPLSDAETFRTDEDGYLLEIGGKTQSMADIKGQYMGLLKLTPEGWAKTRNLVEGLMDAVQDKLDMTSLLQRLIMSGAKVGTTPVQGCWGGCDNEKDLAYFERKVSNGDLSLHK